MDFKTLISGKRIYLQHANSTENLILQDLASLYSVDGQYELVSDMSKGDVVIHLSSLIKQEALESLSEFKFSHLMMQAWWVKAPELRAFP